MSYPTVARLTRIGNARAIVYLLAVGTGLRRRELAMLRWCDIDFETQKITVTVKTSKSRKRQTIDLHPNLVHLLRGCRPEDAGEVDTVIAKGTFPTIRTFWKDLEAAGIARRDDQGRVVDHHALRTTFVTWFTVNQENPALAQAAARHASITTTMEHYTDMRLVDTKGAVDRLPIPHLDLTKGPQVDCAPDCAQQGSQPCTNSLNRPRGHDAEDHPQDDASRAG